MSFDSLKGKTGVTADEGLFPCSLHLGSSLQRREYPFNALYEQDLQGSINWWHGVPKNISNCPAGEDGCF